MEMFEQIELGVISASAAFIFFGTLFSILRQTRSKSHNEMPGTLYEDEDGVATEESMLRYSVWVQKILVLLGSAVGLTASLVAAIQTQLSTSRVVDVLEEWLIFVAWCCLIIHGIALQRERNPSRIFELGSQQALLSAVMLVLKVAIILMDLDHSNRVYRPNIWIAGIQGLAALVVVLTTLCIPSRPDVYFDGRVVDGLNTVGILSRYTFHWASAILAKASKQGHFEDEDIPMLDRQNRAECLQKGFYEVKKSPKLLLHIIWAHKRVFISTWVWSAVASLATYSPPIFMNQVLAYLERRDAGEHVNVYEGWLWVLGLGLVKITEAGLLAYVFWNCTSRILVPVRSQIGAIVFAKTMRKKDVKGFQKADKTAGVTIGDENSTKGSSEWDEDDELKNMKQGTINLIAVDANRVAEFLSYSNLFVTATMEGVCGIGAVIWILGWQSPLAGLSIVAITTPLNSYFSKKYAAAQDDLMKVRDRKMSVVSEALQGVRQIKFSAEEPRWEERIRKVRAEELKILRRAFIADVAVMSAWILTPVALSVVSLSVYAAITGKLTPSVAFPALSIFAELEFTLSIIPELITNFFDCLVSARRIQEYLNSPEKKSNIQESTKIALTDATIAWAADKEDEGDQFCLRNISVEFPTHELSLISGRTGSGKSLLLSALLGEADILSGKVEMPRAPKPEERFDAKATPGNWILPTAVAFVAQIPWIENGSIKDNITFGLPFVEKRYKKTLHACALEKDLEMLPDGELTQIGANGINLSGGQRWRISFARAVYSRAGILILDDIFSAVDAHVGKHIFDNGLTGELMRERTRILVSHHLKLCIPKAKYAISLSNGTIEHAGSVEELQERGVLARLIEKEDENVNELAMEDVEENELVKISTRDSARSRRKSTVSISKQPPPAPKDFITEEERERGTVKRDIYIQYFKASGGIWFWTFLIGMFSLQEVFTLTRNFWVKIWTSDWATERVQFYGFYQYSLQNMVTVAHEQQSLLYYISIYAGLGLVVVLLGTARYAFIFMGSLKASKVLFEKMTFVVLRAPLRWLDTVPTGRILNRFSKDMETIDSKLANDVAFLLYNVLGLIGVNITAIYLSPWIVLVALIILVVDLRYAIHYLTGGRETKRLESISRSPIFELFGSALNGVATIRAFGKAEEYVEKMFKKLDVNGQRIYYVWLFNRWVGLRLSVVGAGFTIFVGAFIIGLRQIDASLAGFVLSFALTYNGNVIWSLRRYASTELNMNSTERVVEYINLPTEDQGGQSPPAGWPYNGELVVDNLEVGYAPDLPPVLKGISFTVKPRERIGVVGRTGAGKSSLTLALFQFIRASSGTIHIDGLDISKLKLADLRSRIRIIPQDPVLFSGTLRSNLDAFNEYTDRELQDALSRVHLVADESPETTGSSASSSTGANANIFESLDSKVSEGGLNLSQGQRQLLCLARAIVSRPRILLMDEATSSVDMETDTLIQKSIREEFTDCTTLVIAHRLATVADYDRILVLGDGRVVEYDSPWNLIQAKGAFYDMVQQSGETEHLMEVAQRSASQASK